MGREKEEMLVKEQARYDAAERAGRRCAYCHAVIPYGDEVPGEPGVCPSCAHTFNKDD